MHMLRAFMIGVLATLSACDNYPRDIEGTRDRIEAQKSFRVGLVAGLQEPQDRALAAAFLKRVSQATGASPQITTGAAEPLLVRLEEGELDLVIARIAKNSPWATDVAVIEPMAEHRIGGRTIDLAPIARNGENRWIMLLERQVRDMGAGK
jgi:hypothetical protein